MGSGVSQAVSKSKSNTNTSADAREFGSSGSALGVRQAVPGQGPVPRHGLDRHRKAMGSVTRSDKRAIAISTTSTTSVGTSITPQTLTISSGSISSFMSSASINASGDNDKKPTLATFVI